MKVKIFFIMSLVIILTLSACKDKLPIKELSTIEKIHLRLNELTQYVATASIVKYSNKGENKYETIQYYKMSGEYRVEFISPGNMSGNIIVYDNENIQYYDPEIGEKLVLDKELNSEFNQTFLGSFMKNYIEPENSSIDELSMDESPTTILEAIIPGDYHYMASEKLIIDNESLNPLQLIIYDKNGNERIVITYHNFGYNAEIDVGRFRILEGSSF